ncbi:MAG: hypothetical protein J6C11_01255 [Spirochaetaceae bacterium]|nr:hypothetical protein [Spirochaetaceae bacterium]
METKKLAINLGFFLAVMLLLFSLLALMVFCAKDTWDKRLQKRVAQTIERLYPGEYVAGNKVPLQGPHATSMAAYELVPVSSQTTGPVYGVIVRVATLFGPLPAVFRYTPQVGTEFIGFAVFDSHLGKEAAITESLRNSMQVARWKKRIPRLLGSEGKDYE